MNMFYCAMENTHADLQQCISKLERTEIKDMSDSEQRYAKYLFNACKEFIELYHIDQGSE